MNVTGGTCRPGTLNGTIIISQATPGLTTLSAHGAGYTISAGVNPAIEDDAQGSVIDNVLPFSNTGTERFGSVIQIDNDQAAVVNALELNSGSILRCDQWFCGSALFGPGPYSVNAGIAYVSNSDISLGGSGNCIGWWNGNDLHFDKSVCQAYSRWGVKINQDRGGFGVFSVGPSVHFEVGAVTNPVGNVGIPSAILAGSSITSVGVDFGANYSLSGDGGQFPEFAQVPRSSPSTQYYYVVAQNNAVSGLCSHPTCYTIALPAGLAQVNDPSVDNVVVTFNAIPGATAYDLLRITTPGTEFANPPIAPWSGNCDGIGTDGTCAIATNMLPGTSTAHWAGCNSAGLCTFTDTVASSSGYSNLHNFAVDNYSWTPMLNDWPGGIVLTAGSQQGIPNAQSGSYYGPDSCTVNETPIANTWNVLFTGSVGFRNVGNGCMPQVEIPYIPEFASIGLNYALGATLMPSKVTNDGGFSLGLKGRLNFLQGGSPPYDVITLYDSKPEKTAATPTTGQVGINRPLADAGDAALCLDGTDPNSGDLCMRAKQINFYVNQMPDGTSWAEQLSSTSSTLKVPLNVSNSGFQSGILNSGTGLKHQRFGATCSTSATLGSVCSTTYSWTGIWPDANYTATCTLAGTIAGVPTIVDETRTVTQITVTISNITGVAASAGEVDCMGIHD